MVEYIQRIRALDKDVRMYLLAAFSVGFSVVPGVAAVLLNLYLVRLDYGSEFIGMLNGVGSLAFALTGLPAGGIGARWGSRRTMLRGLTGVALGYALLPLAELTTDPLRGGLLIFLRVLTSGSMALYFVNTRPLVMAMAGPKLRAYVFSMQGTVAPLGAFLGNLTAGWLPSLFASLGQKPLTHAMPYRWPLALCAIFMLPAIWAVSRIELDGRATGAALPPEAPVRQSDARLPLLAVGGLVVVGLLQGSSVAVTRAFLNVYMDTTLSLPTSFIGGASSLGQLAGMFFALTVPFLVSRVDNRGTYLIGVVGVVLSTLLISLYPIRMAAGIGCVGINAMIALTVPTMSMYQMLLVSERWQPLMSGATTMAMGGSFALVSLAGGYLASATSYRRVFLLGCFCGVAAAIVFWAFDTFYVRKRRAPVSLPASGEIEGTRSSG